MCVSPSTRLSKCSSPSVFLVLGPFKASGQKSWSVYQCAVTAGVSFPPHLPFQIGGVHPPAAWVLLVVGAQLCFCPRAAFSQREPPQPRSHTLSGKTLRPATDLWGAGCDITCFQEKSPSKLPTFLQAWVTPLL